MNPWLVYPTWQHFSSLYREVITAGGQKNEWLRYHHLTSCLYFAISFVEALLNEKYREVLERGGKSEQEILRILRRGSSAAQPDKGRGFDQKFVEWPSLIAGKEVKVSEQLRKVLSEFNEVRGHLTHPKSRGYEVYEDLEKINGEQLLESVAEYAVAVYAAANERYPYWLFGWNYLNANASGFDPFLINDSQFLHSLNYLGLKVPSFEADAAEAWKEIHLKNFQSYKRIASFLAGCPPCEPFDPRFPHRPRLVRCWWDTDVFEKNKAFVKRREPPIGYGTITISPMIIAPLRIEARPASDSDAEQSQ